MSLDSLWSDAGGERNIGKENGIHQATSSSSSLSQDIESKSTIPISRYIFLLDYFVCWIA